MTPTKFQIKIFNIFSNKSATTCLNLTTCLLVLEQQCGQNATILEAYRPMT